MKPIEIEINNIKITVGNGICIFCTSVKLDEIYYKIKNEFYKDRKGPEYKFYSDFLKSEEYKEYDIFAAKQVKNCLHHIDLVICVDCMLEIINKMKLLEFNGGGK